LHRPKKGTAMQEKHHLKSTKSSLAPESVGGNTLNTGVTVRGKAALRKGRKGHVQ